MMASLRAVLDDFLHECLQFCDTLDSSTKSLTTLASKHFNAHYGTLVTGVFHALHVFFSFFFFHFKPQAIHVPYNGICG